MIISLDWIKDFTKIKDYSPQELASRFTLTTAEVEEVKLTAAGLKDVVVSEIIALRPHPEADRLNLVTIRNSQSNETMEVVCGAPNVRTGLKVPYAKIGVTLPNGLTLTPKKIRGVLSEGMLCSANELGISSESDGLLELASELEVGTAINEALSIKEDVLIEVDNKSLTHRPDLWGHLGMAREFAIACEGELQDPFNEKWKKKIEGHFNKKSAPISFLVDENSSCLCYLGLNMSAVAQKPSPSWMVSRLEAVGMRSINLLVDISNYVMLELGIPNHIFDADKISSKKLVIKELKENASMHTLDDVERSLEPSDTAICDGDKPVVIAGIMGGADCEVDENTKNIFLEVANWDAARVRKTSVRLGLRTDSSQRYEKTLDSKLCERTLYRLVDLIMENIPESQVEGGVQRFSKDSAPGEITLETSVEKIDKVLGYDVDEKIITNIFEKLGFKVSSQKGTLSVTVPSYRTTKDISCEADLIEEVGRVIGYDNISPKSPLSTVRPISLSDEKKFHRKIQDFMVSHVGAFEILTYPLMGKDLLMKSQWATHNEPLVLVNALSVDHDRMRPSLIPSALKMVSENQKNYEAFSFFEIGRIYESFENERTVLLLGKYHRHQSVFSSLLDDVEGLFRSLNIKVDMSEMNEKFPCPLLPNEWSGLHPYECQNLRIRGKSLGAATTVHPMMMRNFKAKGNFSLVVIDITDLAKQPLSTTVSYSPLSKFPSSHFDFSVVVSKETPFSEVLSVIQKSRLKELKSCLVIDTFKLSEQESSLTVRCLFEHPDKTLSSEDLKALEQGVRKALEKGNFTLRG